MMVLGLEVDGEVYRHLTESITSGIPNTMVLEREEGVGERGREGEGGGGRNTIILIHMQ